MHPPASPFYASRGARLGAQFLDGLVIVAALGVGLLVMLVDESLGRIVFIGAGIMAGGYYFFADAMPNGQSFGKRALGTAVVSAATGEPCGPGQSFVRNLLLYILGPIDWVFIFGETHQRLGDIAAGTIVVEVVDPIIPEPSAFVPNRTL